MQSNKTHWASLLTLIIFGFGILLLVLLAGLLALGSIFDLFTGATDPVSGIISAFAMGAVAMILMVSAWFVLQKTRGLNAADQTFRFPFAPWLWIVIPAVTVFGILFGGLVTLAELQWLSWIFLPILTLLVVLPPIWLFLGIASNGIELGPRWRFFTILGLGLSVGPFMMMVAEIVMLAVLIVAGAVYISFAHPDVINELNAIVGMMNTNMDENAILSVLSPYLTNPAVIAIGMGYIALLVPLVEELLKPLAVWLFAKSIDSPAQGFALGVISGGAFAIFESLNASSNGTTSWAIIVTARTGTTALHMVTSGLVGWGIASAFKERRIGRLLAAYVSAVLVHGLWNAATFGIAIASLGESVGRPEWIYRYAPAFLGGLVVMAVGIIAVLALSNRKLRKQLEAPHIEQESVESNA